MLMLYGPDTPPKSRAEMEALADPPGDRKQAPETRHLGRAEELAADLAPLIDCFLSGKCRHCCEQNSYGTVWYTHP